MPNMKILEDGAFGKQLGHEGKALRNGIGALIKEIPESSLALFHHIRVWQEVSILQPGSGFSPNTKSVSALIPDFHPQTWKK